MRLVLIRHGESDNRGGIVAGLRSCRGLNERGVRQARMLAERFRSTGEMRECVALLSSPVLRARQTAEEVIGSLPVAAIEEDRDLTEIDLGVADGLTREEYRSRYGEFDLIEYPDRPFAPGGESWTQYLGRVRSEMSRLAERYRGQTVVAITHAGFIVGSVLATFDIPRPGTRAWLTPDNASITEWRFEQGKWQLQKFNDVYHLLLDQ
jgi:broad specificity phosphatase PhoE